MVGTVQRHYVQISQQKQSVILLILVSDWLRKDDVGCHTSTTKKYYASYDITLPLLEIWGEEAVRHGLGAAPTIQGVSPRSPLLFTRRVWSGNSSTRSHHRPARGHGHWKRKTGEIFK